MEIRVILDSVDPPAGRLWVEQRGLVDVAKIPSEKGPPRKVYSLNAQGREHLEEFWRTWSFLAERLEQLRGGGS